MYAQNIQRPVEERVSVVGQIGTNLPTETLDHARDVALNLLRTCADRPSYVLGVTSAVPGEGKSTISTALAEVMSADFGIEVVLVDGNAERHWSAAADGTQLGLSDWLVGSAELGAVLASVHEKCSVLPFGTQPVTSRDILQYLSRTEALAELRERFAVVLLDLPDLMNPAGAALANLCDGLMLVIHAGVTPADRVKTFLPLLENVTIHGAVLNRHRSAVPPWLRRLFT
jgi:Mrp family chromosome partitioning ATPase